MSEPLPPRIDAAAIELALIQFFEARRNFVIPNVKWGWRNLSYEIDLMVVTSSLYAYDIEIKISAGDLRRDLKKYKWRYCREQHYFRRSYFAMPREMERYQDLVPKHAGVLLIGYDGRGHWLTTDEVRKPEQDGAAKKVTETELAQLGRLCMLRMWDLKRGIWQRRRQEVDNMGGGQVKT